MLMMIFRLSGAKAEIRARVCGLVKESARFSMRGYIEALLQ
jgi:hypothetical protein